MREEYIETLRPPALYLLGMALVVSSLLTAVLTEVFLTPLGDQELENTVALFVVISALAFGAFWWTKSVKVSIEDCLLFTGKRGPTLIVRGGRRRGKTYIPLYLIDVVEEVAFAGSKVNEVKGPAEAQSAIVSTAKQPSRMKAFFNLRDPDDEVPVSTTELFAYTGPGLQVTYRAQSPMSGGKELRWKHQFPTADPSLLRSVLETLPVD